MSLPEKIYLRRGEVIAFLGISENDMTALIQQNTLTPVHLIKGGRAHFHRTEVMKLATQPEKKTNLTAENAKNTKS